MEDRKVNIFKLETFKDFLKYNKNENEDKINEDVIYKLRAEPLEDYILDAFKTIESKYLKILDYKLITDESKIDNVTVNTNHIKNSKNKKFNKRMHIDRSRYNLLKIRFKLNAEDGTKIYTLNLFLFKRIKKYYYIIDGNKFYPIYQLIDASTYVTKDYLICKTMITPLILKKDPQIITDVNGKNFLVNNYYICSIKNKINPLYYYLATMGYENTLKYLDMAEIIHVDTFKKFNKKTEYCFEAKGMYVKVLKHFFDNDSFTKTVANYYIDACKRSENYINLLDLTYWVRVLGEFMVTDRDPIKSYIKGKSILFFFNRALDPITKKTLRLKYYNKSSTFALIRWMLRNIDFLRAKDNMDLKNKRIRMSEYIAAYLIKRLSSRMAKFMNNNDIKLKDVETLIEMPKDFLVKTVIGSKQPLLRYNQTTNDQDLWSALKCTIKGPGAIGNSSSNSVNDKYRGVHLSYLGKLDLLTSSNSDPGLSSMINPMVKMHGKFFTDNEEYQGWDDEFSILYKQYFKKEKPIYILDYFYEENKDINNKLIKSLEDASYFIKYDNYHLNGFIDLDVTNIDNTKFIKVKKIKDEEIEYYDKLAEKRSVKKKRKKKKYPKLDNSIVKKVKVIKIYDEDDDE